MLFEKILEFQKIDMLVYKKEKSFFDSQEMQELGKRQAILKEKNSLLQSMAKELEDLIVALDTLKTRILEIENTKDTLNVDFSEFSTLEEFDAYEKNINSFSEEYTALNKELARITKRMSEINHDNKLTLESIKACRQKLQTLKSRLENMQAKISGDTRDDRIRLNAVFKDLQKPPYIDDLRKTGLMNIYQGLRKSKKMPALVPINDGTCSVCCHEIDLKTVEDGGFTLCGHCGRILFKNI